MGSVERRVLFVSKAVEAPWNDSSKNLVRDVSAHLSRYAATTMVRRGDGNAPDELAVYGNNPGGFAPALTQNARVLAHLLKDRRHDLWHFFFAPNARTGFAGRLTTAARRTPTVHTICSAPRDFARWRRSLFADRVVVLSRHTERRLLGAGFPAAKLRRIPPALPGLTLRTPEEQRDERTRLGLAVDKAVVVYAGDLEFGGGAELALGACLEMDVQLVMACRAKTPRAAAAEAALRGKGEAIWIGETRRIHDLLACADAVILPGTSLYAKMDYPLVVLEAMSLGVPVVVGAGTPAEELAEGGAIVAGADEHAVRAAIEAALESGGDKGRGYVRERFAPRRIAEEYEAVYDEILAGGRP